MKKEKNSKKRISNILILILLAIILVSGYNIYKILHGYSADRSKYSDIRGSVTNDGDRIDVNWADLRKTNPDVVGWIYLKDSNIDYPIVQGDDNDRYLHILFDGSYGNSGTLFTDCATLAPFRQFNTVVYGHHMKDGSMFGNLKKFIDPEYAKSHSRFVLATPEGQYSLDVAAFLNCPYDSKIYDANVGGEDRAQYIEWIKEHAEYTSDVQLSENDRLVILSTCAYEYEGARYVVVGKLTALK